MRSILLTSFLHMYWDQVLTRTGFYIQEQRLFSRQIADSLKLLEPKPVDRKKASTKPSQSLFSEKIKPNGYVIK